MNITCIYPKSLWKFNNTPYPPLGIAYIAAGLKKDGHKVHIIDSIILSDNEYEKELSLITSNVVCISATIIQFKELLRITNEIKARNENTIIIVGGPGPTSVGPEYMFSSGMSIDFLVMGEGDYSVPSLIGAIENNRSYDEVPGIYYRSSGGNISFTGDVVPINNIDDLPFPARELLNMDAYKKVWKKSAGYFSTSMISSRGCPFSCIFCYPSLGRKYRTRSAESIVSEMKHLVNKYGVEEIGFWDDLFTISKQRVYEICNLLINSKIKISWDCYARVDTIDKDMIKIMKEAGCTYLCFGVESGSDRILHYLKKGFTVEQAHKAFKLCRENDMPAGSFFIVGVPGETKDDIECTKKFIQTEKPYLVNLSFLTPYPGTKLFKETSYMIKKIDDYDGLNEMKDSIYNYEYEYEPKQAYNDIISLCRSIPEIKYCDPFID